MKLSIIIPGIRRSNWNKIYEDISVSFNRSEFEMLVVGPSLPEDYFLDKLNFKFIRDFGHPSRSLQIASTFCSAKYLCWLPDDIKLEIGALKECSDFMEDKPENDGMTLRYSEGENFTGSQDKDESYWVGWTHQDQRFPNVNPSWRIAPVFLYNRKHFLEIGGLDCRFEHINFNTHDLAYRTQSRGGKIHLSPTKVFSADWKPNDPIISAAHYQHDAPLFKQVYSENNPSRHVEIDNWKNEEAYWFRRRYNI